MIRMILVLCLVAPTAVRADDATVNVGGEEVVASWARCPFVLLMAQRAANRQLNLELDGKVVLTGNAAPRVEYTVKLKRGSLRVTIAASGKHGDAIGWHPPDTGEARAKASGEQLDHGGLLGSIRATHMTSPLVGIFKSAVEECMGVKPAGSP